MYIVLDVSKHSKITVIRVIKNDKKLIGFLV